MHDADQRVAHLLHILQIYPNDEADLAFQALLVVLRFSLFIHIPVLYIHL
jgi:hypothetical protein